MRDEQPPVSILEPLDAIECCRNMMVDFVLQVTIPSKTVASDNENFTSESWTHFDRLLLQELSLAIDAPTSEFLNMKSLLLVILFILLASAAALESRILTSRGRNLFQPSLQPRHRRRDRSDGKPLEVFELAKPPDLPPGATEICNQVLVRHVFGNTLQNPPLLRPYSPSPSCGKNWARIFLRWRASCTGRQFDRISAVWLGGVEILRTCTAEPVQQPGIQWTVEKDVTRYSSLFSSPQPVALELANVVEGVYTGLYNVTLSVHFFSSESNDPSFNGGADVFLPFANFSAQEYWFRIHNEGEAHIREIHIPRNAYKAVMEICVSFHEHDEFWYINPPNEYLKASNVTDEAGNGAFREILVTVDGLLAGVVYPFPVIHTGGVNPYFWRPVSGIGSFVLPSYDVDITPFLGTLVDGERHKFGVSVTNALPSWLLGVNLHVWVDESVEATRGEMVHHFASTSFLTTKSEFMELDGTFLMETSRVVEYSGWLLSSLGNLTTSAEHLFKFSNSQVLSEGGRGVDVHQESSSESKIAVKSLESCLVYDHRLYRFPLRLSMHATEYVDGSYVIKAKINRAWEEERQYQSRTSPSRNSFNALKNRQQAQGRLFLSPSGESRGIATTKQTLSYDGTGGCYSRSLGVSSNGSFLFDQSHTRCT